VIMVIALFIYLSFIYLSKNGDLENAFDKDEINKELN
jgi:hypothetical protein